MLAKEEFWNNYINDSLNKINKNISLDNVSLFYLLNTIKAAASIEYDWYPVLIKIADLYLINQFANNLSVFIDAILEKNSDFLLKFLHRTESKKYPQSARRNLYIKLVKSGKLDKKIARRVRSESSSRNSFLVLGTIFHSRDLYKDDDFQDLISQFSDTPYSDVAKFIAINVPSELIPFLMGLGDSQAKMILDKRLQYE